MMCFEGGNRLRRHLDAKIAASHMMASAAERMCPGVRCLGFSSLATSQVSSQCRNAVAHKANIFGVRTKETAMASTPFLSANSRSPASFS